MNTADSLNAPLNQIKNHPNIIQLTKSPWKAPVFFRKNAKVCRTSLTSPCLVQAPSLILYWPEKDAFIRCSTLSYAWVFSFTYLGQQPLVCLKQQINTARLYTAGQCCYNRPVDIKENYYTFVSQFLMRKVKIAPLSRKHLNQEDSHQLNGTADACCIHAPCSLQLLIRKM